MLRFQPPYPSEFRRAASQLVRTSGKSRNASARELGISTATLRHWLKQTDLAAGVRPDGLTTEATEQVRRLRRELKTRREERASLLNAAACFTNAHRAPAEAGR